jgi:hypothetical protein
MRCIFQTLGWPHLIHVALQISDARRRLDRDRMSGGGVPQPTCPATIPAESNCQFPDVTHWFQRLDATATYKLDQDIVR